MLPLTRAPHGAIGSDISRRDGTQSLGGGRKGKLRPMGDSQWFDAPAERWHHENGLMIYRDGQRREMAKWAHHRLNTARQQAEDAQRHALSEGASACSGVTEDWYASTV